MSALKQRVNLFLTPEVVLRAKTMAAANNISLSEFVEYAIQNHAKDISDMKVEFVLDPNLTHVNIDDIPPTPDTETLDERLERLRESEGSIVREVKTDDK